MCKTLCWQQDDRCLYVSPLFGCPLGTKGKLETRVRADMAACRREHAAGCVGQACMDAGASRQHVGWERHTLCVPQPALVCAFTLRST